MSPWLPTIALTGGLATLLPKTTTAVASVLATRFLFKLSKNLHDRRRGKPLPALEYEVHYREGKPGKEPIIFVHGWPDNRNLFGRQIEHLGKLGHPCLALELPWFGGCSKEEGLSRGLSELGYNLQELGVMVATSVDKFLQSPAENVGGHTHVTLVGHDWGAPIVNLAARLLRSRQVKRLVFLDVYSMPSVAKPCQLSGLLVLPVIGVLYQYGIMGSWFLFHTLPLPEALRRPLCDRLTFRASSPTPKESWEEHRSGRGRPPVECHYVYFQIHLERVMTFLGLWPSFEEANCSAERKEEGAKRQARQDPPTLFVYAGDKSITFHSWPWVEELLQARPGVNRVAPLEGCQVPSQDVLDKQLTIAEMKARLTSKNLVGHWLMVFAGDALNAELEHWLQKTA